MRFRDSVMIESNFEAFLRDRDGRVVAESLRQAHNVVTTAGRNWLSKLVPWQDLGVAPNVPYTQRRIRWMGVGKGNQLEVTTVTALADPVEATASNFLAPISSVAFPTSTSVRFIRIFGTTEITPTPTPVAVTEAGLFADVDPYNGGIAGTEDTAAPGFNTTLAPDIGTNPPVAYKSFEPISKTQDFTLEIRWDFRF